MTKEEALLEIEIGLAARAEKLGCRPEFDRIRRRARRLQLDFPEFLAIARMMKPEDAAHRVRFEALYERMRAKREARDQRRVRDGSKKQSYPAVLEPLAVAMRFGVDVDTDALRNVMNARIDALFRGDRRALRITYDMLELARQSPAERVGIFSSIAAKIPMDVTARLHLGLALADAGEVAHARAEFRKLAQSVRSGTRLHRLIQALSRSCAPARPRYVSRLVTREQATFQVEINLAFHLRDAERVRTFERLRLRAQRSGYVLGEWSALACLKQLPGTKVNERRIAELERRLRSARQPRGTFPYEVRSLLAAVGAACGGDTVIMDARVTGLLAGSPRIADLARRISQIPTCCSADVRAERQAAKARETPKDPEAWLRAGIAATDAGDRASARTAFSNGLAVASPETPLYRLLRRLHSQAS